MGWTINPKMTLYRIAEPSNKSPITTNGKISKEARTFSACVTLVEWFDLFGRSIVESAIDVSLNSTIIVLTFTTA